jgi:hypothetical protein
LLVLMYLQKKNYQILWLFAFATTTSIFEYWRFIMWHTFCFPQSPSLNQGCVS